MTTQAVTITISRRAAEVALDNLYDRLRDECADVENLSAAGYDVADQPAGALSEVVCALEAQGVSR